MSALLNALFCALNFGLYVAYGEWWSLAAALFSGMVFIAGLVDR